MIMPKLFTEPIMKGYVYQKWSSTYVDDLDSQLYRLSNDTTRPLTFST